MEIKQQIFDKELKDTVIEIEQGVDGIVSLQY
jgi:hypothetical protein